MKASATLNYKREDVFKIFVKAAKRDFKDFDEKNPVGCKIVKKINGGNKQIECTIEIIEYEENSRYVIRTQHETSECTSAYTFKEENNEKTLIEFEESQSANGMMVSMALWLQRLMVKKQFKMKFNYLIEELNSQLNTYVNNVKKSTKVTEELENNEEA